MSVCQRISKPGDPRVSRVILVIEKWLPNGQRIMQSDLQQSIKQLHKQNRFSQALEVSEWMRQRGYGQAVRDVVQLDLIFKVHGLEEADKYGYSLRDLGRTLLYGTILNCYVENKHLEKAEAMMQTVKELGLAQPLSYNLMLTIHFHMGRYEDVDILTQGMEDNGIWCNKYAFKVLWNAYAVSSNVERMEELLMKMERDPSDQLECLCYCGEGLLESWLY